MLPAAWSPGVAGLHCAEAWDRARCAEARNAWFALERRLGLTTEL